MSPFTFIGFTCNLVAKVGFSTSLANSCYNEFGIACLWLVNSVPFKQFGGCYSLQLVTLDKIMFQGKFFNPYDQCGLSCLKELSWPRTLIGTGDSNACMRT
jgi:hypothetical protein